MFRLESTWMWQYGHDTIPGWDGKLLIIDTDSHNSLVETNALPGTIAAYGYTIVLHGWITMLYNGREVHYTKDDLIIYAPGMVVSVIDVSDDYRGICLVADKDFAFESPTMRDAIRAAYLPVVELKEPRLTLAEEDNHHLMELMGIIRRYLSQIVREVSGRTVVNYINQMLLMEASYMLQQTSLPIADIAVRLHFSETASFTRFFTRMKGMNPRVYRAQTWHASHDAVPMWLQSQ